MVIHLKKKAAFHVKGMTKTRGKAAGKCRTGAAGQAGSAVRIIRKDSMRKTAERMLEKQAVSADDSFRYGRRASPHSSRHLPDNSPSLSGSGQSAEIPGQSFGDDRYFSEGSRYISGGETGKSLQKKDTGYQEQARPVSQQRQTGQSAERPAVCHNAFASMAAAAGAKTACKQMEGGDELYDACMTADILAAPVKSAADFGRDLYRRQAEQKAEKRIKKVQPGDAVRIKEPAGKKEISKTAASEPGIRKSEPGTGIFKTVSGIHRTAPGITGTISVKKAVIYRRDSPGRKNFQKASETGAGTSKTAAGTGSLKTVSAAQTGDFYTASASETVRRKADKLKIRISRTAGMAETGKFRAVHAAEIIPGTDDKTNRKTPKTADSSGTGISSAPAAGKKSVRTGSSLKAKRADPAAVPKAGVLNPADSMEAKIPETRAAPGTWIFRMPERKTEMTCSEKKTDIHSKR